MAVTFLFANTLIFLFGLCIGSFLNVVIYRLEKKENLGGRSFCPHCRRQLSWKDLFPVFSFLLLGAKCRYCKKKISWQYPIVEALTGLVFVFVFNSVAFQLLDLSFLLYVASVLIVIFIYDVKHYIIPDKVLFPAIAITLVYRMIFVLTKGDWMVLGAYLLAVLIGSGFFLFIFLVSRGRWMGFGDVKLAILMGLLLGFPNILVALFLAFFLGAVMGVMLMLFRKKNLKSEMPFGPFLIVGTCVAFFWGTLIIRWYLSYMII